MRDGGSIMKLIVYTRPDGGVSVVHPAEGARLAFFVTLADGSRLPSNPPYTARRVDTILRRWPVQGVVAEWAESEAEFLQRVQAKSVPQDAKDVRIVDDVPADRTFRDAWKADLTVDMAKACA